MNLANGVQPGAVAVDPNAQTQVPVDPRIEQALKREKMLRAQQIEIQKQKAEIEGRLPTEIEKVNQSWKQRIQSDLLGVARESGIPFETLANMVMTQNPQDQRTLELETKIKALEAKIAGTEESLSKRDKEASDQVQIQMRNEVKGLVSQNAEKYEALGLAGEQGEKAVVKYILDTFAEEGIYPSLEEAADTVEDFLIEQSLGYAKLKKVQSKLTPAQEQVLAGAAAAAQAKEPNKGYQVVPREAQTLTRDMTQTTTRPLTSKERRERAIARLEGRLKD